MKQSFRSLAATALAVLGCSKPTDPATPPAVPSAVTTAAENKPAANVPGEVNAFLTEQLAIFIQQKQRLPADFAELARTRLDSVPRPPEGRKWVIDTATRQVKAVAVP